MSAPATPLRLKAETPDDLSVIAAALQDAVVKVSDMAYDPRARAVTCAMNRFRWEADAGRRARGERVRAGLRIDGVLGARRKRVPADPDAVLSLLTLDFAPDTEPPGGELTLRFADGVDVALTVDCVDVTVADVSAPWRARARPAHGD